MRLLNKTVDAHIGPLSYPDISGCCRLASLYLVSQRKCPLLHYRQLSKNGSFAEFLNHRLVYSLSSCSSHSIQHQPQLWSIDSVDYAMTSVGMDIISWCIDLITSRTEAIMNCPHFGFTVITIAGIHTTIHWLTACTWFLTLSIVAVPILPRRPNPIHWKLNKSLKHGQRAGSCTYVPRIRQTYRCKGVIK